MDLCAGRRKGARHRKFYQGLTDALCSAARAAILTPTFQVDIPPHVVHLWHWFIELHQGRQDGYSRPQALSWPEMAVWASLTKSEPSAMEWRALRAIDMAWLDACRELAGREQSEAQSPNTISERPMSPELFDAIF